MDATLKIVAKDSGVFTCMGCNGGDDFNCEISQVNFFVTTLPEGFHISGPERAVEGDTVDLVCGASKYNYTGDSLAWYKQTRDGYREVTNIRQYKYPRAGRARNTDRNQPQSIQVFNDTPSKFDIGKRLRFQSIEPSDSGVYVCQAKREGPRRRHNLDRSTIVERQMEIKVQELRSPEFSDSLNMNKEPIFIKDEGESIELRCKARGYPTPRVEWFLNDSAIDFQARPNFLTFDDGQSLRIAAVVAKKSEGKYTCKASSRAGESVLHQIIRKVQPPEIYKTDMFGSDQTMIDNLVDKVVKTGAVMNLTCQATGQPRPGVSWLFNNSPVNESAAGVKYANHNQTIIIENFQSQHEGKYECVVTNLGGSLRRYQWVKLLETQQRASIYNSNIAIPVFIAIGAVLVLAIVLVLIAKACLSTGRWSKTPIPPPTPPTPRLTQFDLPPDQETEETESCRLTLSRDGSPYGQAPVCHGCQGCSGTCHACNTCHYNYNGLYGCHGGSGLGLVNSYHHGGSVMGVRALHSPTPVSPPIPGPPPISPSTALLGECTTYPSYSQHTLPAHRMDTLRREMSAKFKESRRSVSPPRVSVDF